MHETEDGFYETDVTLVVDEDDGVKGTTEDVEIDGTGQIEIEVRLRIPKALFRPILINVEIPKELLPGEAVKAVPKEVAIPVMLGDKTHNIKISEEVTEGNESSGILAFIRKIILWEK